MRLLSSVHAQLHSAFGFLVQKTISRAQRRYMDSFKRFAGVMRK